MSNFTGEKPHTYPECLLTAKGKEYMGTVHVTESGRECIPWRAYPYIMDWDKAKNPKRKPQINYPFEDFFLNQNSIIHHNYCRNPSVFGAPLERPWCYVLDPVIQWEYCNISTCDELGNSQTDNENKTV